MSELNKNQLKQDNQNSFPNNNTGYITPTILRDFNNNMIDSLVDEISYNAESASFNTRINNLDPSGSAAAITALEAATASLNAYTASQNSFNSSATASIVALQSFSSSLDATFATDAQLSASVAALSSSVAVTDNAQSASIAALQSFSSSLDATFATDAQLSASVSSLSSSVAVTDLAQSASIAALQQFSSSLDSTFATDAELSASVAALSSSVAVTDLAQSQSIAQLLGFSASIDTSYVSEAEFGAYSSSINSYTQSNDTKWNNLGNQSGSFITESETGSMSVASASFATTASFALNVTPTDVSPFLSASVFNAYTQSNDSKVNSLINATGSYVTEAESGSFVVSVLSGLLLDEINVTKGDGSVNTITVNNVDSASYATTASFALNVTPFDSSSLVTTQSFNSYTQSNDSKVNSLINATGSYATTGSNQFKASQSITGSLRVTSDITASGEVRTTVVRATNGDFSGDVFITGTGDIIMAGGASNNIIGVTSLSAQAITASSGLDSPRIVATAITASAISASANITASNLFLAGTITATSASFQYVQTVFETASIIYSSGSNQLGDELSDVQTLSGSVKVQGELLVNGVPVQTSSFDASGYLLTSSFNSYTASASTAVSGAINSATQSLSSSIAVTTNNLDLEVNQKLDSASFNSYTQSNDSKVNSLINATGSYITSAQTSSMSVLSSSFAVTASFALNATGVDTGSLVTTASFNQYTQSEASNVSASINAATQSLSSSIAVTTNNLDLEINQKLDSSSFNSYTASEALNVSGAINTATGSSLVTASVAGDTITFTKGNGSTFPITITVATGSLPSGLVSSSQQITDFGFATTSSVNSLSQSVAVTTNNLDLEVNGKLDSSSFNSYTQSNDSKVNSLIAATGSYAISSSVAQITSASQGQIDSLISATGSYITSAQTASMTVLSASFAQTASFLLGSVASASFATSASFAETASEARNVVLIARNQNASTLPAGTLVHIVDAVGDNPIFNTASFDSETLSANTLGMLRTSAASGADVEVLVNGIVTGVNTDPALGYVAGDILYLSSSGQFTRVQPQAPLQIVVIGQVLRAQQNNGSVYVNISNGWELDELHNVAINGVADGDLLVYRSGSGLWTNSSSLELGLATTGSNTFVGNQVVTGSVILSSSADVELQVIGNQSNTGSLIVSGGFRAQLGQPASGVTQPIFTMSGSLGGNLNQQIFRNVGGASDTTALQFQVNSGSLATEGLQATIALNNVINTGSFISQSTANISIQATHKLSGVGGNAATITLNANSGSATASLNANLIRIGTSATTATTQFSSSIVGGLNFTGSTPAGQPVIKINASASNGNAIEILTGSVQITSPQGTGFFYTNLPITSSHARFNGQSYIKRLNIEDNGGLADLQVENNVSISGSLIVVGGMTGTASFANNALNASTASYVLNAVSASFVTSASFADSSSFATTASFALNAGTPAGTVSSSAQISAFGFATTGSNTFQSTQYIVSGAISGTFVDNAGSIYTQSNAVRHIVNLGSASYASIVSPDPNTLYVVTGDESYVLISQTGSFATTGSNVFKASQTISGSVYGEVKALSISSNTASLDLSTGNFFTLQLVSGSSTNINPSNIRPGQTINIRINTTGSGVVTFPSSVKQQSGSAYVPTTTTGVDVVTLVSFDSTNLYLANVKNLI